MRVSSKTGPGSGWARPGPPPWMPGRWRCFGWGRWWPSDRRRSRSPAHQERTATATARGGSAMTPAAIANHAIAPMIPEPVARRTLEGVATCGADDPRKDARAHPRRLHQPRDRGGMGMVTVPTVAVATRKSRTCSATARSAAGDLQRDFTIMMFNIPARWDDRARRGRDPDRHRARAMGRRHQGQRRADHPGPVLRRRAGSWPSSPTASTWRS